MPCLMPIRVNCNFDQIFMPYLKNLAYKKEKYSQKIRENVGGNFLFQYISMKRGINPG